MAKIQYTIRIEEETFESAKFIAEKEVRSLNNLFEYFITKGVESFYRGSGAPESAVLNDGSDL